MCILFYTADRLILLFKNIYNDFKAFLYRINLEMSNYYEDLRAPFFS